RRPVAELVDVVVVHGAVVSNRHAAGDAADVRMRREDAAVDDRDSNALPRELAQIHTTHVDGGLPTAHARTIRFGPTRSQTRPSAPPAFALHPSRRSPTCCLVAYVVGSSTPASTKASWRSRHLLHSPQWMAC